MTWRALFLLALILLQGGCSGAVEKPASGGTVEKGAVENRVAGERGGAAEGRIAGRESDAAGRRITVFVGAASKPPTEEAISVFQKRFGIRVEAVYGGSGTLLAQIKLARRGDIYFPGSSDYMERAKREGVVRPGTERVVAYLVPAINVPRGNPQGIRELRDLARPGLRVGLANPETVCLGGYAVEIVERNLHPEEEVAFKKNVVTLGESCEKTANLLTFRAVDAVNLLTFRAVDAVIGWSVFENWNPERIETVKLKPREVVRIGYLPLAVTRYSSRPDLAEKFIEFLLSPEGKAIYRRHGYFMTPEEAFRYVGEEKPVGGEYRPPVDWVDWLREGG